MVERASDRWISIVLSVLLHGVIVGLLGYGWWIYRQRPPEPAALPAIDATVVDASAVRNAPRRLELPELEPEPVAEPGPEPRVEPPEPPGPTPEELEQQAQTEREAAEQAAEEQRQLEEQQRLAEERRLAEQSRLAEEARLAEERRLEQERLEAERKAREEAEAKRKAEEERRLAEKRRIAEEKRRAEEKRKAEEERLRAQREAELRRSLEEEERVMAARSSGALASWISQITARVQRAWLRPPSARAGLDCVVYVTQVPGGEVVNVRLGACNGDQAVRESIEAAVYRASPLPPPPDPALFERNLEIRFRPVD